MSQGGREDGLYSWVSSMIDSNELSSPAQWEGRDKKEPSHSNFLVHSCYVSLCLTLRRLTSYIYGVPILDVSRSHTTTQHSR